MKLIAPDYYTKFKCIADKCAHSCCVGWEIDIDDESYERYQAIPGEFGERLRGNITLGEEGPYFGMTAAGRCPFLNANGLCDMITELGEESLCQICADHPRFRNYVGDREELGLGLCCEAAGMLILGQEAPVRYIVLEDDGAEEEEDEFIEYRDAVMELIQDRSMSIAERVQALLGDITTQQTISYPRWAEFLTGLERLDDTWADYLAELSSELPEGIDLSAHETAFEQLLVYLLWRHMASDVCDCEVELKCLFAIVMWSIIYRLCEITACQNGELTLADIVEISRLYSSEIEYSDENIGAILTEIAERGL